MQIKVNAEGNVFFIYTCWSASASEIDFNCKGLISEWIITTWAILKYPELQIIIAVPTEYLRNFQLKLNSKWNYIVTIKKFKLLNLMFLFFDAYKERYP